MLSLAMSYFGLCLIATRPLLRQIENLQSVHNAQTINWERVEESLSEKLGKIVSYSYKLFYTVIFITPYSFVSS